MYQYIKNLVGQSNGKVENWRNISEWLEAAGYKHKIINGHNIIDYLSLNIVVKQCDITVRKYNLNIKNNYLLIDLNIRLATPLLSDANSSEDLKDKADGKTELPNQER